MNDRLRLGIIGLGMGMSHARSVLAGKIGRLELAAVSDLNPKRLAQLPQVKGFPDARALIRSGEVDAVLVATPHFTHTTIGIEVLNAGLHLLVEKPLSVHKADCERVLAAFENRPRDRQVFAAMFNQRTDPYYQKIRQLVQGGELGEIRRVNWIVTDWFRTDAYYAGGGWRATWRGEGGGVLLNQCMHQIDLLQWIFGMPARVRAHCAFGKYHPIEVEDEVTAYMEFPNGASGVFIASTGETPGTNRLQITAEHGKLVYENDEIRYIRNDVPMTLYSRRATDGFGAPGTREVPVVVAAGHGGQHVGILQNFTDAILDAAPLLAPGVEGIHSVELANAMVMSAWKEETVALPLDGQAYQRMLEARMDAVSVGRNGSDGAATMAKAAV